MKVNINKMYKNKRKIDDERTQKCCYEIENSSGGEDKFIASLVLAKEIARTLGGRAVIIFD